MPFVFTDFEHGKYPDGTNFTIDWSSPDALKYTPTAPAVAAVQQAYCEKVFAVAEDLPVLHTPMRLRGGLPYWSASLISQFVNHTDRGGNWHNTDVYSVIPTWTSVTMAAALGMSEALFSGLASIPFFPLYSNMYTPPGRDLRILLHFWSRVLRLLKWKFGTNTYPEDTNKASHVEAGSGPTGGLSNGGWDYMMRVWDDYLWNADYSYYGDGFTFPCGWLYGKHTVCARGYGSATRTYYSISRPQYPVYSADAWADAASAQTKVIKPARAPHADVDIYIKDTSDTRSIFSFNNIGNPYILQGKRSLLCSLTGTAADAGVSPIVGDCSDIVRPAGSPIYAGWSCNIAESILKFDSSFKFV